MNLSSKYSADATASLRFWLLNEECSLYTVIAQKVLSWGLNLYISVVITPSWIKGHD